MGSSIGRKPGSDVAAAAARRAAEQRRLAEQRRAAEKALAAAAKKTSNAVISSKAGQRPTASAVRQAFGADELSKGVGRALRERAQRVLASPSPSAPPLPGRTTSLAELRALEASGRRASVAGAAESTGQQHGSSARGSARLPPTTPTATTAPAPPQTPADRAFAALTAREGTRDTLQELGIKTSGDLTRFGDELAQQARSGQAPRNAVTLSGVDNQVALAEIVRASGRASTGENAELLTDDTFANSVAAGNTPREAATAVEAKALFEGELERTVDKRPSRWTPEDAVDFSDALADLVEKHSDDPTLVNQLLVLSQERLERTAVIIGKATESNDYDGDDIEELTANLSRIGNAAPDDGAAVLATVLAAEIDDDSELNKVDDGFKQFIKDGGDSKFRAALNAALEAQGKGKAAEELREDGGGSSVGDRWGAAVGAATDLVAGQAHWALSGANAVYQAGGDALRGEVGRVLDVVDAGLDAVDAHGPAALDDAAGAGRRGVDVARTGLEVQDELQARVGRAAVEGGTGTIRVAGGAVADPAGTARATAAAIDQARRAAAIGGQIDSLGQGDELKISAKIGGAVLGIDGELNGDLTITRTADGYTVRAAGTVGVGLDSTAGAEAGPAGASTNVEAHAEGGAAFVFTLGSGEDATRAVRTLLGPVAGGLSGVNEGTLDGFRPDPELLTSSIASVEVRGGAAAQLAANAGIEIGPEVKAQLQANATMSARIELGDPPALVISGQANVTASATTSVGVPGGPSAEARAGGNVSLNVSQRFLLPETLDVRAFVRDPVGTVREVAGDVVASATTTLSLTVGAEGRVGAKAPGASETIGSGVETRVTLEAPTGTLLGVVPELLRGDFSAANRELAEAADVNVTVRSRARARAEVGVEGKFGDGVDSVEVGFTATRTDYGNPTTWEGTYAEAGERVTGAFADAVQLLRA